MSASLCLKCSNIVSMYQKYCDVCIKQYGVAQDADFWKSAGGSAWDTREIIFQQDLEKVPASFSPMRKNAANNVTLPPPVRVSISKPLTAEQRTYRKRFGSRPKKERHV